MGAGENGTSMMNTFTVSRMDPSDILNLASEFVVQYYTVMRKCPSGLHRFYKDDSAMIRENSTVFGQKPIHDKIMSMEFQNSRVGILRLDALRANGNSVLIQVSGEMSVSGEDFRRFMQSFVLCEQAPCDFYVLNDIFRYQDQVYGDVKVEEDVENKHTEPEHLVSLPSEDMARLQASRMEPENIVHWENPTPPDIPYSKVETVIDSHGANHPEEVGEPDAPQHIGIHSSASPQTMVSALTEESLMTPTEPPRRTWAQMASKQPSHNVLNMQSSKYSKVQQQMPMPQSFDESKGSRQSSVGGGNLGNQRPRGAAGRVQEGRGASGDHVFPQDNRPMGQGPMRTSSGRGGPIGMRGGRGGRGGFGNPPTGGRGAGSGFSRRGQ